MMKDKRQAEAHRERDYETFIWFMVMEVFLLIFLIQAGVQLYRAHYNAPIQTSACVERPV